MKISRRTLAIFSGALVLLSATGAGIYFGSAGTGEEKSPTEVTSPLPDTMANVLAPTDVLSADEVAAARPWVQPSYEDQTSALGWSDKAFSIPDGLRARVDFWKTIYSKYSTDQGVLHDPVTLEVYDSIQFDAFHAGDSLTAMARSRSKIVDARRREISDRLLGLQARLDTTRASGLTTPFEEPRPTPVLQGSANLSGNLSGTLSGEELRYWNLFASDQDPRKFAKAAARIRFQLGQRDKFLLGIYYSGRYLPAMEKIFREEGLPIELTRLPFVESSFNTRARSKVGASGIWQFMRRTAKPYLKINQNIDERNEPLAATRAAARLMKGNFNLLRSWPLAVTAWNHGPSGVRNIAQKLETEDLARIVNTYSSRTFGFASQNFYACFLAVLAVESDAHKFFAKPVWQSPLDAVEIKTPARLIAWSAVVNLFGDGERTDDAADALAQDYNPQINSYARSSKSRIPAGTRLLVPAAEAARAAALFSGKKTATTKAE